MAANDKEVTWSGKNTIEILKWKVRKGSMVSKGSVLALYAEECNKLHVEKLKSKDSGLVIQVSVEEGAVVHPGGVLLVIQPHTEVTCTHPTIMKDMCADCGIDLRREMGVAGDRKKSVTASVAMVHSIPELIVSQEQALELGKEDENRLLRGKKLVLLVDLDQTLIHTTNDNIPPNLKGVKHFQLWHGKNQIWYHTRFRPFTQHFLEAVSKMYELHICTFGVRMYAHLIARFLDPDEKYFSHRILSRDECFDPLSKTANLKALFPCGDKMVGIIDDREDVWNHAPNLIHVKPYRFFQGTADINAPPGLTKSEHDNEPISHKVIDHSQQKNDGIVSSDVQQNAQDCLNSNIKDKLEHGSDMKQGIGDCEHDNGGTVISEESKSDISEVNKCAISSSDVSVKNSKSSDVEEKEMQVSSCVGSAFLDNDKSGDVQMSSPESKALDPGPAITVSAEDHFNSAGLQNTVSATMDMEVGLETTVVLPENNKYSEHCEAEHNRNKSGNAGCVAIREGQPGEVIPDQQNEQEQIEWTDDDDYLLHLEEILTRIHKAYYEMYEQCQNNGSSELPDLKNIIPYVRKKTLKGANIVFTGMFPLNLSLEKSQAYLVAKSLGANVQNDIVSRKAKNENNAEATTHLVTGKPGTGKHKTALKMKGIHIVSADWLWACNERWEWVSESLYSLVSKDFPSKIMGSPVDCTLKSEKPTKKRKILEQTKNVSENKRDDLEVARQSKKSKLESDEFSGNSRTQPSASNTVMLPEEEKFANSFNPLYSFSDEDIEFMGKEVEELMGEDDDSSAESDEERDVRFRQKVLGAIAESDSDSDSLSGDFPRGWKLRRKSFSPHEKNDIVEDKKATDAEDDDETENELTQFQKNMAAFAPDESESDSDVDKASIGSVDDEIAEAVEKEFLASL
ncbi:hypothetical protein BsWGS_16041 [Bradybaena similaris]